ncbi:MAG: biotin--[acetyl-CoA-carboxylase] ligase [Alphaproteobacteria bacterium]|nr:biotin--[acetyl-CoA-carboxylase] ligase [Alphaproteobacteria bacterium]
MRCLDTSSVAQIEWFDELDSTSSEAFRRAEKGSPGNLWIAARNQSAGRGRFERCWDSRSGNLHASLLLRFAEKVGTESQLSFVSALALFDSIKLLVPRSAALLSFKWPNDLFLDGAKVSGILIESKKIRGQGNIIVIGIGVNCVWRPDNIPYPVTDFLSCGFELSPNLLLEKIASFFQSLFQEWNFGSGFPLIRTRWLEHAFGINQLMRVQSSGRSFFGTFESVKEDGSLLIQSNDGSYQQISAGDVFPELLR